MGKKATDIVAYLGPIGLIIAYLLGSREESGFHLNQALVLCLASIILSVASGILGKLPLLGGIIAFLLGLVSLVCFVLWIMGIASAISGTEKQVPILGNFQLLK